MRRSSPRAKQYLYNAQTSRSEAKQSVLQAVQSLTPPPSQLPLHEKSHECTSIAPHLPTNTFLPSSSHLPPDKPTSNRPHAPILTLHSRLHDRRMSQEQNTRRPREPEERLPVRIGGRVEREEGRRTEMGAANQRIGRPITKSARFSRRFILRLLRTVSSFLLYGAIVFIPRWPTRRAERVQRCPEMTETSLSHSLQLQKR